MTTEIYALLSEKAFLRKRFRREVTTLLKCVIAVKICQKNVNPAEKTTRTPVKCMTAET